MVSNIAHEEEQTFSAIAIQEEEKSSAEDEGTFWENIGGIPAGSDNEHEHNTSEDQPIPRVQNPYLIPHGSRSRRRNNRTANEECLPSMLSFDEDAFVLNLQTCNSNTNDTELKSTSCSINSDLDRNERQELNERRANSITERRAALDFLMSRGSRPASSASASSTSRSPLLSSRYPSNHSFTSLLALEASPSLQASKHASTESGPQIITTRSTISATGQISAQLAPKDEYHDQEKMDTVIVNNNTLAFNEGEQSVSFSSVEIRYYERVIGDHPSCSSGPSISIGWNYDKKSVSTISVKDYEEQRPKRRTDFALVLSRDEREQILENLGYSFFEIAAAVRVVIKTKNRRRQTINNLNHERLEETLQSLSRSMKKMLRIGRTKKKKG